MPFLASIKIKLYQASSSPNGTGWIEPGENSICIQSCVCAVFEFALRRWKHAIGQAEIVLMDGGLYLVDFTLRKKLWFPCSRSLLPAHVTKWNSLERVFTVKKKRWYAAQPPQTPATHGRLKLFYPEFCKVMSAKKSWIACWRQQGHNCSTPIGKSNQAKSSQPPRPQATRM